MGTLQIGLLDTSFTIQASEDTEYLSKLLGYYERIVRQIKNNRILREPTQIAIMAGLMLCDELYKEKSEKLVQNTNSINQAQQEAETEAELERRTLEMIQKISRVIDDIDVVDDSAGGINLSDSTSSVSNEKDMPHVDADNNDMSVLVK